MKKFYFFLILLSVAFFFLLKPKKSRKILKTPGRVVKLKDRWTRTDLLFEKEDIRHYTNRFDILDFDLNEEEVIIPDIDYQNVHDTDVQGFVRNGFEEIPENHNENCCEEIKEYYKDDNINNIIDFIKKRNSPITNLQGKTEVQVLQNAWGLAKTNENIKDYLRSQLLECLEVGAIVCPTGVVNRIVSSCYIESPELLPRTKNQIDQEMMQTAANVRDNLEKQDNYIQLPEEEKHLIFKKDFIERLKKDYKEILEEEEIIERISPWLDHV